MTDSPTTQPPRLWLWLVRRLVGRHRAEQVEGDLLELWALREPRGRLLQSGRFWLDAASLTVRRVAPRTATHGSAQDEARVRRILSALGWDLHHGLRVLRSERRLTTVIALTLALGVGASAAAIGLADTILFRPLPVPDPDRVVALYALNRHTGVYQATSYPAYLDLAHEARSFDELAAYLRLEIPLRANGQVTFVGVEAVSPNFFALLQIHPMKGRAIGPADEHAHVAMVSERLWRLQLAGSDTIQIGGQPFEVVGVVPASYTGQNYGWDLAPDVWIPIRQTGAAHPQFGTLNLFDRREIPTVLMIGRLRPNVTLSAAGAEMQTLAIGLPPLRQTAGRDVSMVLLPASRSKFWPAYRLAVEQSMTSFVGASGLVLLLVGINIANLLAVRARSRRRELAVRMAVGASTSRLVQQLAIEGSVFALPGIVASIVMTWGAARVMLGVPALFGTGLNVPWTIDAHLVGLAAALAVVTTIACTMTPAWRARRLDLMSSLALDARTSTTRCGGLGPLALVTAQVALCGITIACAVFIWRATVRAQSTNRGSDLSDTVTVTMDELNLQATAADRQGAVERLTARIATRPDVGSVAVASDLPLDNSYWSRNASPTTEPGSSRPVDAYAVGPDFFDILRVPIAAGRAFLPAEIHQTASVTIVSQALANRFWPHENPIGRTVFVDDVDARLALRVIGVVRDLRYRDLWSAPGPTLYLPDVFDARNPNFVIKTRGEPRAVAGAIMREWSEPTLFLGRAKPGTADLDQALAPERASSVFFGALAILAILIAAVGLYGTVAHALASRTREIGVRIAIGGGTSRVIGQIVGPTALAVTLGAAAGIAGAGLVVPLLQHQARGMSAHDVPTLIVTAVILVLGCATAMIVPAWRVSRVDPVAVLRSA